VPIAMPAPSNAQPPATVLALDCGSSTFKGGLFDVACGCLAEAGVPVPYLDQGGAGRDLARVELDPEAVWQAARDLIRTLCREAGRAPGAIDRIVLTSQAQTFALLDAAERPLTPFLSWLDARPGPEVMSEIEQHLGQDFHAHCSFAPPLAELQLAKVLWLRRHAPALLDQARQIISLPSYLTLRLAGIAVLDPNLAAMSGLYSLRDGEWWPAALALCGVTPAQLPTLVPLGGRLRARRPCPELDLSAELEVLFAGNDQTAGAFGNGCGVGELVVTLGTALVAYRVAGTAPGPYSPTGCWGPYPDGGYYELAVLSEGCLALDWAREQLLPGEPVEAFMAQAALAQRPGPPGLAFYPNQMGTTEAWRTPSEGGLPTVARRALAVLEGIGFALRRLIVQELGLTPGAGFEAVTAVGGGSRSDFWLQLLAHILGGPVRRGAGTALTGACVLATPVGVGVSPRAAAPAATFYPDPALVRLYRARYATWCDQERRLD
jgi:xylulokinase